MPVRQASTIFGVWAAPAAQKSIQKVGGFAPHFLEWFWGILERSLCPRPCLPWGPNFGHLGFPLGGQEDPSGVITISFEIVLCGVAQLTSGLDRKLKSRLKFWSVLGRFPAQLGPKTPPDGSGSKNGAERTQNPPMKPIRMPFCYIFCSTIKTKI